MADIIQIEAYLKDQISSGLKTISENLKHVESTSKSAGSEAAGAMKEVEKAAGSESEAVNKSKEAHQEAGKAAEDHAGKLGQLKEGVLGFGDTILQFATAGFVVGGVSQAFDVLSDAVKETIADGERAQQTEAGLAASLAATGKSTGVTTDMAKQLAESLSTVTTYSADTILSGESMLATFDKIGKNTFPQATQMSLDLAAKLGISVPNAARLMGRALEDPAKGMTQLTRYGITLSTTQSDQIKKFMKLGDVADAQNLILSAMHSRLGDVATAMGDTLAGKMQILQNQMELTREKVGEALIPVFTSFMGIVNLLTPIITDGLTDVLEALAGFITSTVVPAVSAFVNWIHSLIDPAKQLGEIFVGELRPELEALGQVFGDIGPEIQAVAGIMGQNLMPSTVSILPPLKDFVKTLADDLAPVLAALVPKISIAFGALMQAGEDISSSVEPAFAKLTPGVDALSNVFHTLFNTALSTAIPLAQEIGSTLLNQVIPAVGQFLPSLVTVANVVFTVLIPAIASLLGDFIEIKGALDTALVPVIGTLVAGAFRLLGNVIAAVAPVLAKIIPLVVELAGFLANALGNALRFLAPYVQEAAKQIANFANDIAVRAAPVLMELANLIVHLLNDVIVPIWDKVWPLLSFVIGNVFNEIVGTIQVAWSIVTGLFKIILDLLSGNWSQAWKDFQAMLSGVWAGIERIFQSTFGVLINLIASGWNHIWSNTVNSWNIVTGFLRNEWNTITGFIGAAVTAVKNVITGEWNIITNATSNIWNGITSFIGNAVHTIWSNITNMASAIKNAILAPFQDAANAIGGIMKNFANFGLNMLNGDLRSFAAFVNDFGGAINWVAGKLGHSAVIPHFNAPQVALLATGTDSFKGGMAIVGEEGPELVTLPRGSKVMPAPQTRATMLALHGLLPRFAGGIGNPLSDIGNMLSSAIGDVTGWISKGPSALLNAALSAAHINISLPGSMGSLASAAFGTVKSYALSMLSNLIAAIQSTVGVGVGGTAAGVLHGFPLMNQLALTDVNKDFDCVPTSLAAAASYLLGHILSPVQLKDAVYGASYYGGTSPGRYSNYLRSLGVGMGTVSGSGSGIVGAAINNIKRGIPTAVAIPSSWNSNSGSSTHEVVFAGYNAGSGSLIAMNPWGGFWQSASPAWWAPRIRYGYGNPMTKMGSGGLIREPIVGIGLHSGGQYVLGERGPETVTPGGGHNTMGGQILVENHIYLDGRELGAYAGSNIVQQFRTTTQRKV